MRRVLLLTSVAFIALGNSGCLFLNAYSPDPQTRTRTLMNQSEDLRQISGEVQRFWMTDQPSHLTYDRLHGGIGPGT